MQLDTTATRVWKKLTRDERLLAATAFWKDAPPELAGSALGAVIKLRRLRPQVARSLPVAERASALAGSLEPGEPLAGALLVALHLEARRPLLCAFLDALGLPHENGLLKDEAEQRELTEAALSLAAQALHGSFPAAEVRTYFNTLWLQDPVRWAGLERVEG
jgi:hypothetical protein